jgi:hypothetical protein
MSALRIAITSNGPGEFAGWVRPLARALTTLEPDVELHLFFVPDDYATRRESAVAREIFPGARVHGPLETVAAALGGRLPRDVPDRFAAVQYLGGDLQYATRLATRLNTQVFTYKFSRPRYHERFAAAFAIDERNRAELIGAMLPEERVSVVGNLAIDGALDEAAAGNGNSIADGAIVLMPGSRRRELLHLWPHYGAMAVRLRKRLPNVPIIFALSPFNTVEELRRAFSRGGDPRFYGVRGVVAETPGGLRLRPDGTDEEFPVVRDAMRFAARARLVVAVPGTKLIEVAALGVPALACATLNVPEFVVVNGALTYLDRIPLIGGLVKRAVVCEAAKRHPYLAQPNIDFGEMILPELRGTLTPGRVADEAARYALDDSWRDEVAARLRARYAEHRGAARRMAHAILARC